MVLTTEIISLPSWREPSSRPRSGLSWCHCEEILWATTLCEITPLRNQIKTCEDPSEVISAPSDPSEAIVPSINTQKEKQSFKHHSLYNIFIWNNIVMRTSKQEITGQMTTCSWLPLASIWTDGCDACQAAKPVWKRTEAAIGWFPRSLMFKSW